VEVRAQLRFLRATPRKVRLVADLIRGKGVQEAVNILHLTNKSAAKPLEKLLKSAIANAESRDEPVDVDRLFVKEVMVDGGPTMKRFRPAPMGRGFRVLKRSSHVTMKLDTRKGEDEKKAEKKAVETKAVETKAVDKKPAAKKAKPVEKKAAAAGASA
jgi:large subunit ribosomal protein L22